MANMTEFDVSIIMVNYHQARLTIDAVESVIAASNGFSYEFIIVDNSESDAEVKLLQEALGGLKNLSIVQAEKNVGFGGGNNIGSRSAKGRYLFFLNTDTSMINNAIFELLCFMEKNPDCSIAGGNLFAKNGEPNHSFVPFEKNLAGERKMSGFSNWVRKHIFHKRCDFNYGASPIRINGYVCGADLMIRRETFLALGGFDEAIFMYAEEALLCFRAIHEMNAQIYNVPSAKIVHFEGASFSGTTPFKARSFVDGNCVYYRKAFGTEACLRYLRLMKRKLRLQLFYLSLRRSKRRDDVAVMLSAYQDKIREVSQEL